MDSSLALQEFLEFIVGQLVDEPDKASIRHEQDGDRHFYHIRLAQGDVGKIIGKNGYTISAIRSLFQAAAQRNQIRATLKVDES